MANEISQFNGLEAGELRFGCGPAPAAGLIPRAIGAFIGRYPKARVQFQVDDWQSLSKRLMSEEFEFFVADTRYFEADPDYQTHRLRPRKWHFCCRAGHPLAAFDKVSAEQIRNGGLYAYTAINAPRGLDERIYHVWQFNGKEVDRIALDIHGGRKEGYRAWTHKQNFPADSVGRWQVRVLTEDGQVIGVLRFKVTDTAQTDNPK